MDEMQGQVNQNQGDQGNNGAANQAPGWVSGLPDDQKSNETFTQYKTVGDFAKAHLETLKKATDLEGKLANSIPKLPADATPEDKATYYSALGRPEKPTDYELAVSADGVPLMSEKMAEGVKNLFHQAGLNKEQGKTLSQWWNDTATQRMAESVQARDAKESELKATMGEANYKAATETVKRVWGKFTNTEAEAFLSTAKLQDGSILGNNPYFVQWVFNIAKMTGEDKSVPGNPQSKAGQGDRSSWFPNSPKSPTGK